MVHPGAMVDGVRRARRATGRADAHRDGLTGREQYPSTGCYLEVVDGRRLIWTSALGPGYRPVPVPEGEFHMTAIIDIVAEGSGTRYTAIALHDNEAARKQHEEMGFHDGWSAALDQMVAMIKG